MINNKRDCELIIKIKTCQFGRTSVQPVAVFVVVAPPPRSSGPAWKDPLELVVEIQVEPTNRGNERNG